MLQLICDSISQNENTVPKYVSHNLVDDKTGEITLVVDSMYTVSLPDAEKKTLIFVDTLGFFTECCKGKYRVLNTIPRRNNLDRRTDYYYLTDISTDLEKGISVSLTKMGTFKNYVYHILIKENIPMISR